MLGKYIIKIFQNKNIFQIHFFSIRESKLLVLTTKLVITEQPKVNIKAKLLMMSKINDGIDKNRSDVLAAKKKIIKIFKTKKENNFSLYVFLRTKIKK